MRIETTSLAGPQYGPRPPLHREPPIPGPIARPVAGPLGPDVREAFETAFEVTSDDRPAARDAAHRLRYEVYCVEFGYEDAAAHPAGREIDAYDARACQSILTHRASGLTAGAVRLVLPDPDKPGASFPLQEVFSHSRIAPRGEAPFAMAEISRFTLAKAFRARRDDAPYPGAPIVPDAISPRVIPHISIGLMRAIMEMSVAAGVDEWCAAMEPALLRLLRGLGVIFEPLGSAIEFHGRRVPCYGDVRRVLTGLRERRPEIWAAVTRDGALAAPYGRP